GPLGHMNGVYEYFDKSMKKNWAGPEHWRIQALRKNINNASTVFNSSNTAESSDNVSRSLSSTERKKRRELDNAIDFLQEVDVEALFTPATSSLKLPKSHWKRHNRCLLPDDYQYDSKRLLQLFLKPKMSVLPNAD
uniref:Condensin complex subunit 2 n=1 Tax=Schizosaccharomyces pombe (strain 972 / ATCC 24843) TaxID=284812 RepID=UPI000BEE820E|nr:Chain C, Condensin complex subunit 2 [Schizosaccharomyces pombe 972h-]5OQR_D Chain D, Condensin complex subunit 2 [Schizosaccharomyces pombe 972h-]